MNQRARLFSSILVMIAASAACGAACAQGTVTLEVSQDCYVVGDTVSFTLTNNLDSTIYMPHSPVWSIWDTAADSLVYPYNVFWLITSLGPDSSETFKWPQIDYHLNQVGQGPYRVQVTYSPSLEPWNPNFTVQDSFYVGGASAADAGTWGSIKAMYR